MFNHLSSSVVFFVNVVSADLGSFFISVISVELRIVSQAVVAFA